jgi:hypothetical protein
LGVAEQPARKLCATRRQLRAITQDTVEDRLAEVRGENSENSMVVIDSKREGEKARRARKKGVG